MIGLIFSLTFAMFFMISILIMDTSIACKRILDWVDACFSHDTSIFKDFQP